MRAERLRSCPVCLADAPRFLFCDEGMTVVRCTACSFVYVNPVPQLDDLAAYYTDSYADTDNWEPVFRHDRSLVFSRGLDMIRKLQPAGRLLDVGCSLGFFLEAARDAGYEVQGVELAASAAEFARQQLRLDVFSGSLKDARYPDGYFNIVTLWDVLEHLDAPNNALSEIRRITAPEALLVVRVPNITFHLSKAKLIRRICPGRAIALDAVNHLNHYSAATLTRHLCRYGFEPVLIRPGVPNLYGKPLVDTGKRIYAGAAAVLAWCGLHVSNIIEVFARRTMSGEAPR